MGVAARIFDWRAGFFFFAIIWAALVVVAFWAVPGGMEAYEAGSSRGRLRAGLGEFDVLGTALTVFGVGLLTTGLTWVFPYLLLYHPLAIWLTVW
jgi:predicted MFS family arabinose efflux permease